MNTSPQIELTSKNHLGLAIDETRLVRLLIECKNKARKLMMDNPLSEKLFHLNIEISYLEAKLIQVRSKASRA